MLKPQKKLACYDPFQQIQIGVDGKVCPCCHYQANGTDYPDLGNVHDNTIMEIWNGEGYQKLRKFMLSPEGAKGCPGCYERMVSPYKNPFEPVDDSEEAQNSKAWKNYELMVQEIDEGKTELSCKPGAVMYFPSIACNFQCVICAQAEMRAENIRLPARMDEEVMDLLPYMVMFHIIGGEPFIQPVWKRLLKEYSMQLNPCLKFEAITNGALVNQSLIKELSVFPAVWITFSFDGSTRELFDSIRVSKAGFDIVYANLLACIKYQSQVGVHKFQVNASMTVQKANIHDMVNMLRIIREKNADITFSPLMMQPIPLSLRHYNDAPTEIGLIKEAFASAEKYWNEHPEMHPIRTINYHTIELLNEQIPYNLLDKKHYWAEGNVTSNFAKWFRELYGEKEKPYILFFPIENGEESVCQYYALVDENWHYKVRLPEGEYRVAMTKFHVQAKPWSSWRLKLIADENGQGKIKERPNLPENFSINAFKACLARYSIVRKMHKAISTSNGK